jgi:lipoate-protein ligase A
LNFELLSNSSKFAKNTPMLLIERPQTDPYFNLAAEEYLLKTVEEECFMLWVNEPSVIVGKHQNAFAEVDRRFVKEKGIPVIRRISGGGAVFHDPGNLNFSFISTGEKEKLVDFRRFMQPVISYLVSLGLPARFEGKNDIRINGRKVSGNAEHVFRNKILHHGTLLFSTRMEDLSLAIRGKEEFYSGKAVKSIRSPVTNVSGLLQKPMDLDDFRRGITGFLTNHSGKMEARQLSTEDVEAIHRLAEEKYRTWEWNFGYSPGFSYRKAISFNGNVIQVELGIRNGIIESIAADVPVGERLPLSSIRGLKFDEDFLLSKYPGTSFPGVLSFGEYKTFLAALLY